MKFDLETARADKFEDILKKKPTHPYECKLRQRSEDEEPVELIDVVRWLEKNAQGRWQMVKESNQCWGFAFQLKKDAMLWKLTWG